MLAKVELQWLFYFQKSCKEFLTAHVVKISVNFPGVKVGVHVNLNGVLRGVKRKKIIFGTPTDSCPQPKSTPGW